MRRIIAAAIDAFLLLGASTSAQAKTYIYRDVRMPNAHPRSQDVKLSDGRFCGFVNGNLIHGIASFNASMRAHGWALDHVETDASDVAGRAPSWVLRGWCAEATHDCSIDDIDCMSDPDHVIARRGCNY